MNKSNSEDHTELSRNDWEIFLAMLEDDDARPNDALVAAAEKYRSQME